MGLAVVAALIAEPIPHRQHPRLEHPSIRLSSCGRSWSPSVAQWTIRDALIVSGALSRCCGDASRS